MSAPVTVYKTADGLPPFFRGERGEWDGEVCDFLLPDGHERAGDACDAASAYLVYWKPTPFDGGTLPCSGACVVHAQIVDRNEVERMFTHPLASGGAS